MRGRWTGFGKKSSPAASMSLTARAEQIHHQRTRQANGEAAEALVELEMQRRGDRLVEKVEVPFRIDPRTGRQFAKRKVSGDFRAVRSIEIPNIVGLEISTMTEPKTFGVSVLVEVKHHDERLAWSAFRPHQILALDEHMLAGGITEVAWYDRGALRFIPWSRFRKIGFGDRKSVVWTGTTIEIHIPTRGPRATTTTKAPPQ